MDLRGTILKLKESIFMKKGTGQPCEVEEKTLQTLESQLEQKEKERAETIKAIEGKEKAFDRIVSATKAKREKLVEIVKQWQDEAVTLFEAEREAEHLADEIAYVARTIGLSTHKYKVDRAINLGSQRVQWVNDDIYILTEDFRFRLIASNRDFFEKRGRRRRAPVRRDDGMRFNPEQYETLKAMGIDLPSSWHLAYRAYSAAVQKAMKSKDGAAGA